MQEFSAAQFYRIGQFIAHVSVLFEKFDGGIEAGALQPGTTGGDAFQQIRKDCEQIGLQISVKALDQFVAGAKDGCEQKTLIINLSNLTSTIRWEIEDRLFIYVPPERAEFYNKPELLGREVNAKFPTIQFDIVEAGNCYATGRGTAVVFHLMRIMETGVQQFGDKLGVPLANEKVWQVILDGINSKIKALPKSPATVEMSEAAANLYAVKLAWRNEVMHPKDTYTLEEADNLIRQVRIFMQQLAKII